VNVIPDRCTVQVSVRLLPEMEADVMTARVRTAVVEAVPGESFELTSLGESPAMMLDEGAVLHRELCGMVGQRSTESVAFATDAGWLQRADYRCAVFGPGSIEVAHRPNEFLPIAEFERAGELLDDLIHRRCLSE
jgi:acetylornithine deacetylase